MPTPQLRPSSSALPTADAADAFLLVAVDGPSAGTEAAVPAERPLTVGRMSGNGLVVRDDSLSRRHFQLLFEEGELRIEDLGSSYGTFLNEERLSPGVPRSIQPQDAVRAGQSQFALHPAPAARPAIRSAPPAPPGGPPAPAPPSGGPSESESNPGGGSGTAGGSGTQRPSGGTSEALDVPVGPDGLRDESVSEICARAGLEAGFARPGDGPATVLEQLAELDPDEALKFLAAALPPRAAVRWAADCVQSVATPSGDAVAQQDADALAAALAWADDPTEANRRACEAAAQALNHQTAAAWCAMAAFFSHGSLGPVDTAAVPAPPTLSTTAVNAAVTLAAVEDPAAAADRRQAFLERRGTALEAAAEGRSGPAAGTAPAAGASVPAKPPARSPARASSAGEGTSPPKPPRGPGAGPSSGAPTPPKPPAPPKPPS